MENVVSAVLGVFGEIADWIPTTIASLTSMFYATEGGLTLLGTLSLMGLGISVVFLLIGVIQKFLHFRG